MGRQKMARFLVSGANRGIGLEFCRQLAARGDEVIAVCRKSSDELQQLGVRVIDGIDLSEAGDVARLSDTLSGVQLDVLINNAGVLLRDNLQQLDFDGIELQWRINAVAPLRVSAALLKNLKPGSKVFTLSSSMGSVEENTSGGYYGYRMSKAAVNMAMKSLSVDLKERGIGVFLLHPGFVQTDMTGNQGHVTAAAAVRDLIARIDSLELTESGSFTHAQGRNIPW